MRRLLAPALLAIAVGCATLGVGSDPKPAVKLYFDNAAMEAELANHVPAGTPVAVAKSILRSSGFEFSATEEPTLHCEAIYGPWYDVFIHPFSCQDIGVTIDCQDGVVKKMTVHCFIRSL
jgi:hypothetical protein